MDDFHIIRKKKYKEIWGKDLKKDFVVIKQHIKRNEEVFTPQKTFASRGGAKYWIKRKRR